MGGILMLISLIVLTYGLVRGRDVYDRIVGILVFIVLFGLGQLFYRVRG